MPKISSKKISALVNSKLPAAYDADKKHYYIVTLESTSNRLREAKADVAGMLVPGLPGSFEKTIRMHGARLDKQLAQIAGIISDISRL